MLVAVYGTLRNGQNNHERYLGKAEFIGTFESLPIYNLYNVNDFFPGLQENGIYSVLFEVYKVTPEELKEIDRLEGYNEKESDLGMYTRSVIDTPYGDAFTYFYKKKCLSTNIILTGDWIEFNEINKLRKYAK